jgi:hypothetical protein
MKEPSCTCARHKCLWENGIIDSLILTFCTMRRFESSDSVVGIVTTLWAERIGFRLLATKIFGVKNQKTTI